LKQCLFAVTHGTREINKALGDIGGL